MSARKQLRSAIRSEWDDKADCIGHLAAACRRSVEPADCVAFAIQLYAETVAALERGDLDEAVRRCRARADADKPIELVSQ